MQKGGGVSNEAAEALRRQIEGWITNDGARAHAVANLEDALAHERSEVVALKADEHWHRGPAASCSICRSGVVHGRSVGEGDAVLDVNETA